MSASGQRAKGMAEEVSGKIKKAAGKVLDNERLEAEGRAQELKGEARQEAAKGVERAKGKLEQAGGAVKAGVGRALGNPTLEADGEGDTPRWLFTRADGRGSSCPPRAVCPQ
jgi:uncharacterized protein YjbJ (UPF0337 family)